jgi:proteasome lid subunit RPN8/RPN11
MVEIFRGPEPAIEARIVPSALARLRHLASVRSPVETGGLLLGAQTSARHWTVRTLVELLDPSPSNRRYRADPHAVRDRIYRRVGNLSAVVGMFHTHPDSPASPSALDSRAAAAGYLHAIVGAGEPTRPIRVFHRTIPGDPLSELRVDEAGSRAASRTGAARADRR